jgi:hypothetical protein
MLNQHIKKNLVKGQHKLGEKAKSSGKIGKIKFEYMHNQLGHWVKCKIS